MFSRVFRLKSQARNTLAVPLIWFVCALWVIGPLPNFSLPTKVLGGNVPFRLGKMMESDLPNNQVRSESCGSYSYFISQNKGLRKGEDIIVTSGCNGIYNISILMDGHGGQEAVKFAGQYFQESLLKACADPSEVQSKSLADCIQSCFQNLQDEIRRRRLRGGAAVVVKFVKLSTMEVVFAWAGDAEALVIRNGRAYFRTTRHGLENINERTRIMSHEPRYKYVFEDVYLCSPSGNCVMPTRGLGDIDMEQAGYISLPEVSNLMALEAGDVVLLASDGIWDVLDADLVAQQFVALSSDTDMLSLGTALAKGAIQQWIRSYGRASEADDISLLIYKPLVSS